MIPSISIYLLLLLVVVFLAEMIHSYKDDKQLYTGKDTLQSLLIGAGYFTSTLFSKLIMIYAFQAVYKYHIFNFRENWFTWVLAFIAADFSYYLYHLVSHKVNWFWASHVVHHSSEEFNISVAFRLPWIKHFDGDFIFWIWMPLLGCNVFMTLLTMQLVHIYQGFLHTKLVGKLHPVVEYIFNTPSHHRVHHSSNLEYLDKNHGGVLIIWDRLFNSFKAETVTPVYGLTKKLVSNKPFKVIFQEWKAMFVKASKTHSFKLAICYFIKSPGWSHDGSSLTVKQIRQQGDQVKMMIV